MTIGRLLHGNWAALLPLSLGVCERFAPVILMMATSVALLQRARFSAELLLSLLIIRLEFDLLLPIRGTVYLSVVDVLILAAITRHAYVLRGRGVFRTVPALSGVLSAAGLYCLVPGLIQLAVATPLELQAVIRGAFTGASFVLAVVAAPVRILAGVQLLRNSWRAPQTTGWLCAVSLLRVAVAVFWPVYMPVRAVVLMADLAVVALITRHAFALRSRGVLTGLAECP